MSDPGLYLLRYSGGVYRPLRGALEAGQDLLPPADREPAVRALRLLNTFAPWVDRLPADELLRRLVASTDYRAILAGSRSRLWRNIDKLLRDARASGLVRVRAFLDWVDAIKDSGAREGEAVAEAVGAVRLMTIHKSKGLEFPVVVLADAAHRTNVRGSLAYLLDGGLQARCWTLAPDRVDGSPLVYRLAKYNDSLQSVSETGRLLYVAMTRAMEKVIFSGHVVVSGDGSCRPSGWLGEILDAGGADLTQCLAQRGIPLIHPISERAAMALCVARNNPAPAPITSSASGTLTGWPISEEAPLAAPLIEPAGQGGETPGEWRAPPDADARLALITGGMVHEALRRWPFARENAALENLLRLHALQGGLREGPLLDDALRGARALIARFTRHPLFAEINAAAERCHALPVSSGRGKGGEVIDLLFRAGERWTMVDFLAGAFHDAGAARAAFAARVPTLRARREILRQRIGQPPRTLACFLDVQGMVQVFSLPESD
jgi:hypothetical protein